MNGWETLTPEEKIAAAQRQALVRAVNREWNRQGRARLSRIEKALLVMETVARAQQRFERLDWFPPDWQELWVKEWDLRMTQVVRPFDSEGLRRDR